MAIFKKMKATETDAHVIYLLHIAHKNANNIMQFKLYS